MPEAGCLKRLFSRHRRAVHEHFQLAGRKERPLLVGCERRGGNHGHAVAGGGVLGEIDAKVFISQPRV